METEQLHTYLAKVGFCTRIIYVGAFFLAAIIDTKIVWDIATVIGPIATIPNLLALILLRKEMKQIDENYKIVKNP